MKYKGIELTEITTPNIDNLPKKMLVWWHDAELCERVVCATALDNCGDLFFIARQDSEQCGGVVVWPHCAEIPKPRRATHRELSQWLAEGKGEVNYGGTDIYHHHTYSIGAETLLVDDCIKVRKRSDTDWHEPTVDYMGLEGK